MHDFDEQDYTKKFELGLWRKIVRFALKYKKTMIALIVTDIVMAAVDSTFPQLTRYSINTFLTNRDLRTVVPFVAAYILLIAFQASNTYRFIDMAGKIETSVVHDVREKGFKKLQELSFAYFDRTPVGWIMARMTTDAQRIGDTVAWSLVDVLWSISYIVMVFIFMMATNFRLALFTMCVVPVMVVLSVFFQRKILRGHREARKINSKITGAYNEGINGAKTTKTLIREQKNFEEFQELSGGMLKASIRVATLNSVYFPIMFTLSSFGVGLVIWQGGGDFLRANGISLGDLTAFIAYASSIFDPINQLANILSDLQSAQASAERTISLLETESEITDDDKLTEIYGSWEDPKRENWQNIKGDIEFRNVSFKYKNGENVLKDFSLKVKAGEKIALVGETGAGKSTIVNLVCRFYEPTEGQVLIDGVDYRERTQIWLQSNLGYVLQSPHLFSGSIKDNIRYGKLDATDEEIENAARMVNALPFISKLEKGFDSDVGEGGARLSSGEKQLISFARAIIGDPRVFVLDEATSSIDAETEQIIQKAIFTALEGRTSFIVAHRLSTIRSCDRILVIADGAILESGSHMELLKMRGRYYDLYTNQFKEEEENKILNAAAEAGI